MATIQPEGDGDGKPFAAVMIADVTGRQSAAQRVLDEAARQLEAKGAQRRVKKVGEHELVIYDLPRQRGEALADQVVRFMVDDLLVMATTRWFANRSLQRYLDGSGEDNLASLVTYRRVMDRVQSEAGAMAASSPLVHRTVRICRSCPRGAWRTAQTTQGHAGDPQVTGL